MIRSRCWTPNSNECDKSSQYKAGSWGGSGDNDAGQCTAGFSPILDAGQCKVACYTISYSFDSTIYGTADFGTDFPAGCYINTGTADDDLTQGCRFNTGTGGNDMLTARAVCQVDTLTYSPPVAV